MQFNINKILNSFFVLYTGFYHLLIEFVRRMTLEAVNNPFRWDCIALLIYLYMTYVDAMWNYIKN